MKITTIETLVCHARMRNWIFVKVLTDQPGLWGWGEATLEWHTRAVVGAIEDIAQLLVGEDPTRIEHLWQMMYRQHFWHGNGIVRGTAISGHRHRAVGHPRQGARRALPQALGRPGARLRPALLPPGRRQDGGFLRDDPDDAQRFAELARAGGRGRLHRLQVDGRAADDAARRAAADPLRRGCVAAMRDAVGDEIDIMVDCHARPSPRMGLLFAKALEPYGLYWFEEPCWPETLDDIAAIQRVGEHADRDRRAPRRPARRSASCWRSGACSVLQPDITHCGGLTEARRIAAMAEAYRVALAPHNPQGPVSTAASLEFGFATPSYIICESVTAMCPGVRMSSASAPHRAEGRTSTRASGRVLGSRSISRSCRAHPFEPELPQRVFYADGSVGDW